MKKPLPHLFAILILLICVTASAQTVDFGKSYVNINKGVNGGTVEPGDTLEIRATFVVRSGTLDSCAFYDTIKAGTSYVPNSMAILTNEGKIYKAFTDPLNIGDCGWYNAGNVRIHLGFVAANAPATAFRRGQIRNTHRPNVFGACVMVCSYRVVVTAALGSQINVGGGAITYRVGAGPIQRITYPSNAVAIYTNSGICSNSVGVNALGTEANGTFGSGRPRNRGISSNVPASYTFNTFTTNGPGDYYYGIANNTSTQTNYSTSNAWAKPDLVNPTRRVFRVWDIIGDHTGAPDPLAGHQASDTVSNGNGGYMLVVNSSYRIDSAFQHTITGLCPNTYYEISAWMRNICSKCGNDSANVNASSGNPAYIPTGPGDSSGVHPNVTFEVDGIDYYSTGNIRYSGQWIKKGFTYLTGPSQTSFTLKFFNNAPGGGGNDWALDDIAVATCTPNLTMLPSGTTNVCLGNQVDMSCLVRSYFPNYVLYSWERSTNGGVSWLPTGVSGTATPTFNGSEYEYTAVYPSFIADSSSHLNRYRIRIASTSGNLADQNCSFADVTTIQVWVNNCQWLLDTKLKSFSAKQITGSTQLEWVTESENEELLIDIERSTDQTTFFSIGTIAGKYSGSGGRYVFHDNDLRAGIHYYRLKLREPARFQYSRQIAVGGTPGDVMIRLGSNPFRQVLNFEIISAIEYDAMISVYDSQGRQVYSAGKKCQPGNTLVSVSSPGMTQPGMYTLRVVAGNKIIVKKVIGAR